MRGGPTRRRLLRLLAQPRNKLQLANEAGIDWKAVDRHIGRMLECSLVRVSACPRVRVSACPRWRARA